MSIFRFKRFSVRNENSAMKVGTDGALLGAAVRLSGDEKQILDAGTGTGVIALIISQRLENQQDVHVIGIDIDRASAQEAQENFAFSPWREALSSKNIPLLRCEGVFDLIISNPPYYDSSLKNPDGRQSMARHTVSPDEEAYPESPMSYRTLIDFSVGHLSETGRLALILPADQEKELCRYARMRGLHLGRVLRISTTQKKRPSRILTEFSMSESETLEDTLVIGQGTSYTPEYSALMHDFYLWA